MTVALDDAGCVARTLKGDVAAFEPLVRRYERVLYTMAYRLTANAEDARDATQNAFVRAFTRLETFDASRSFFSWIYRIAVNEALNLRRSRPGTEPLADLATGAASLDEAMDEAAVRSRVRAAVARLPRRLRDVIVLRHFAELSYHDIADTLGVPEKTVKSRLFSARQRLGAVLAPAAN
jgi:RNA polymerase sigma-70 factor (ECF subfamily)